MQFVTNDDYPRDGAPVSAPGTFQAPRIDPSIRHTTRIVADGQVQIARHVIVPMQPSVSSPYGKAGAEDCDSDDDSSSDSDMSTDAQRPQELDRAYWLRRSVKNAIYGQVWSGVILRRRHRESSIPLPNDADQWTAWESTGVLCAVKEMDINHINQEAPNSSENPYKEVAAMQYLKRYHDQSIRERIEREGRELSEDNIRHESEETLLDSHVMMPIDVLTDNRNLYLVMPYCDGGELFDVLDNRKKFPEEEARYWMHQILTGIETLQRAGICHRDMSLENLLTSRDGMALIIDLGMCLKIPYEDNEQEPLDGTRTGVIDHRTRQRCLIAPDRPCGKPYYMTNEILENNRPFDGHAVDMWAVGPILFLMVSGFPPWELAGAQDERFNCFTRGYFVQTVQRWNLGLSGDILDLLQRMFFLDPRKRLSLEQVRAHPWMQGPVTPPPPAPR